jgi:hypothetical protein
MSKETDREDAATVEFVDVRFTALALMGQALAQIDSDNTIPAIVGARLQTAIDALERCCPNDQRPINLH